MTGSRANLQHMTEEVAKACAAECSSADTCAKAGTLSLSTEYLVFCWAHGLGGFTGVVLLTSTDML